MMEKYLGIINGKTYWIMPVIDYDRKDALRAANKKFKTSLDKLQIQCMWCFDEILYDKKPCEQAELVWAVWRG